LTARRLAVLAWIVALACTALFVARLPIDTDMTAFLPDRVAGTTGAR
jgi:hypothetical protein